MKKLLFIVILPLLCINCDAMDPTEALALNKAAVVLKSQLYAANEALENFEVLHIDDFKNFTDLTQAIEDLACADKRVGLEFTDNDTIYKQTAWTYCSEDNMVVCSRGVRKLSIKNDSLLNLAGDWKKKSIRHLAQEVSIINELNHAYENNKYSSIPTIVYLNIDDEFPIAKTKEVLKEITKTFYAVRKENEMQSKGFTLVFSPFDWLGIPPPPPPPPLGWDGDEE